MWTEGVQMRTLIQCPNSSGAFLHSGRSPKNCAKQLQLRPQSLLLLMTRRPMDLMMIFEDLSAEPRWKMMFQPSWQDILNWLQYDTTNEHMRCMFVPLVPSLLVTRNSWLVLELSSVKRSGLQQEQHHQQRKTVLRSRNILPHWSVVAYNGTPQAWRTVKHLNLLWRWTLSMLWPSITTM